MDTKNVIANIDANRSVLDAQVKRLSELGARAPSLPSACAVREGAAELLAGTVLANLAAAAEALQAAAEAETETRTALRNQKKPEPVTIEGEARVVE